MPNRPGVIAGVLIFFLSSRTSEKIEFRQCDFNFCQYIDLIDMTISSKFLQSRMCASPNTELTRILDRCALAAT